MKMRLTLVLLGAITLAVCQAKADDRDTALKFVNEYIRELSAFNEIRVAADNQTNKGSATEKVMDEQILAMINSSEKFQLELNAAIANLKDFRFSQDPFDKLVPAITNVYQTKIELWRQTSDILSQFLVQKEGVDYGKLAAEMPKIRARLEYQDQTLLKLSPVIFMTLMDFNQKDQSKPAHLSITRAERNELLSTLRDDFGAKLDSKGQNYEVSTARLLKEFLLKSKCADEVSYR